MVLRLLPSPEQVAVAHLKGHASITALVGTRVATQLPAEATFPFLTVSLVTGEEKVADHLDEAILQLDAWGADKAGADLLIRTARAVMRAAPDVAHTRAVVNDVRTVSVPRWSPDTAVNPPRPRYTADVGITLHPHPL